MPTVLPVPIHPAVLLWARQESGYPVERVAERLQVKPERIAEWEQGLRPPTLRQVEALAHFYHRPLSVFFQPKPPITPALAAEYRRLPGVVAGQESPELRLALRKMSARRETMVQLLVELGEATPAFDLVAHLAEPPATVAARLRSALAVSLETQFAWANEWQAWAAWRAAVERLGVLVFQFPKVPLAEARGLSLLRSLLPVAAVNSKEMPEPRSFTLIHEVVHLMLAGGNEEVPAARETRSGDAWAGVERFAEETASHTLVPEAALTEAVSGGGFPRNGWDIGDMRSLARRFRISPLAMATRLRASGYFDWAFYLEWKRGWETYVAKLSPKAGGFAHPITQTLGRAGRPFTQVVLEALAANRITAVNAARYLDLKFEHFGKLKEALESRPGSGGGDE
jgi:Zn-dependent peptidase ImmA (M78 family)/transcriptional regulator with XRE-family HTH domain